MATKNLHRIFFLLFVILFLAVDKTHAFKKVDRISISCEADNDLYLTLKKNKIPCQRYDTPEEAINKAPIGTGVLVLADGYPTKATNITASLYKKAYSRKLRLYVEYPSFLPGIAIGSSRSTKLERVVVSTSAIKNLAKMQILTLHNFHYLPVSVSISKSLLAVGKVAGFDNAVYGLDEEANPSAILFDMGADNLLVSTTKLSQFITARYAPKEAMQAIWTYILFWLQGAKASAILLDWTPTVRASYTRLEKLPENAARLAIERGIDWNINAKMLLSEDGWEEYKQLWKLNDSNMLSNLPYLVDNAAPQPKSQVGDGRFGILEGIASEIGWKGNQPTRWWLRSDCNGESSLAFALKWKLDGDKRSRLIAGNLLDWVYFRSGLFQNDPRKDNYGLLFWAPGSQALYEDNDIKSILGCIGTSGILDSDKWDKALVKNILGNFRTTGVNGFRGPRLENSNLLRDGWQYYWYKNTIAYQPHYEAWVWSSYLWLYDKTKWKPLLEKTRKGISMMMKAYPKNWTWQNGFQQERGRMLLPLAWLIRVDDRPEYRAWLKQIANDIEKYQDKSGAIREELGSLDQGKYAPATSNATYGKNEAPLIQENGDKVADLLYTCNFTFLGLHEAYAATGDEQYKRIADRLAEFLIRIQVKSEKHKDLDGGWFRAFDYDLWDYWGSNADAGWGAWSIEVGWTQGWIPTVLALRELNKNLWDISENSKVGRDFESIRRQMIPDQALKNVKLDQ